MRILTLLLAMGCTVMAQPVLTPIHDTIYDQSGNLYNGPLTISLSVKSGSASNAPVLSTVSRLQVKNGALALSLVPNSVITPAGSSYLFAWGNGGQRTCTIPESGTAIVLAPYCTDNPPANPSPVIPLSWLAPVPSGQALCGTGTGVAPGTCGGGGGLSGTATWAQLEAGTAGSGTITATMTWAQIEAL